MHHFDLQYDIVRLRHDELVQQTHPGRGTRRGWFGGAAARPARRLRSSTDERRRLVAVPPPRHAAAEHDTQVA